MKIGIVALALLLPLAAFAGQPFADRVAAAKKAETSPEALAAVMSFMKQNTPELQASMDKCFKGSPAMLFTVIANLTADGQVADVEAEPASPQVACYIKEFERLSPKIVVPAAYKASGMPIFIETRVNE